jgi:septal ring factor EnvC (AmiA/AmiB activator)
MDVNDDFNEFMLGLCTEAPNNRNAKELELVRLKQKRRKVSAKYRKQQQRLREMAANLRATKHDINNIDSDIVRVKEELNSCIDESD